MTQNFKAEYEKSASAIITAVTKSGTQRFPRRRLRRTTRTRISSPAARSSDRGAAATRPMSHGTREARLHALAGRRRPRRPDHRGQAPLLRLVRAATIRTARTPWSWGQANRCRRRSRPARPVRRERSRAPSASNLAFGKLSWQADPTDLVDVVRLSTGTRRRPGLRRSDQRPVARTTSRTSGTRRASTRAPEPRSSPRRPSPTTTISGIRTPTNADIARAELLRTRSGSAAETTTRTSTRSASRVREDFSYLGFHVAGRSRRQGGRLRGELQVRRAEVPERQSAHFQLPRPDEAFAFPFEAFYGVGNPDISASNNEYGVYVQDDWTPTARLTVNVGAPLGLRDRHAQQRLRDAGQRPERAARASCRDYYFTDGTQRPGLQERCCSPGSASPTT